MDNRELESLKYGTLIMVSGVVNHPEINGPAIYRGKNYWTEEPQVTNIKFRGIIYKVKTKNMKVTDMSKILYG